MKTLILTLGLALIINQSNGQQFTKEDVKYASLNIISSSLIGGFGSAIHKKQNQTFWDAFKDGLWKGSISGTLNYGSKKMLQIKTKNDYAMVWPARIVNSLSNSIKYNAIYNESLFSSYNLTLWFFNFNYKNKEIKCKIDPFTLGSFILLSFNNNYNFNLKNSLLTGSIFFDKNQDTTIVSWYDIRKYGLQGKSYGNTIWKKTCKVYDYYYTMDSVLINNNYWLLPKQHKFIVETNKEIALHEIIHTFQYEQFNINALTTDKICKKINININKYLNINPNFGIIYTLFNISGYYNNIFEKECNYFMK